MVVAKLVQIRVKDGVAVWEFYENADDTEPSGSRGMKLTNNELQQLMNMTIVDFYKLKTNGIDLDTEATSDFGKIAKRAYDEYMSAKKMSESERQQVIE